MYLLVSAWMFRGVYLMIFKLLPHAGDPYVSFDIMSMLLSLHDKIVLF